MTGSLCDGLQSCVCGQEQKWYRHELENNFKCYICSFFGGVFGKRFFSCVKKKSSIFLNLFIFRSCCFIFRERWCFVSHIVGIVVIKWKRLLFGAKKKKKCQSNCGVSKTSGVFHSQERRCTPTDFINIYTLSTNINKYHTHCCRMRTFHISVAIYILNSSIEKKKKKRQYEPTCHLKAHGWFLDGYSGGF